ncbi:hypothetical protein GCM10007894_15260 [Paraferrimonas haliotis]|uniref:Uncharacterized protein n=1 Tax=Paraferrimonas haliotis TaxID=2013866 RepID=A0AA37TLS7_9GAMM|nr:hypothetical protein GCM10007894_15260 [Paraferrimonas haliotis]
MEQEIAKWLLKLSALIIFLLSIFLFSRAGFSYVGTVLVCFSVYFYCYASNYIKQSTVVYLLLMSLFSLSLVIEFGNNKATYFVITVVFASFYYINYKLVD